MNRFIFPLSVGFLLLPILHCISKKPSYIEIVSRNEMYLEEVETFFLQNPGSVADGFDFPVGPPNAKGYWDAQPFGKNFHLGQDWNASGRNDYGDPVHSIGNGVVKFAEDEGPGWGNVLIISHKLPDKRIINSLYAHLSSIIVAKGDRVKKGQKIGAIGDANKLYSPHLHFEIRTDFFLPTGGGYSRDPYGYTDPRKFILENRKFR